MAEKLTPVRVNPVLRHPLECRSSLSDSWRFRLDPEDIGLQERWFEHTGEIVDPIQVPGCWQGQGYGHDGLDMVADFQLYARTLRATYTGTGWYARDFTVPAGWESRRLWLNFGGAHPSAEVWLNGRRLGENDLPFVPFGFDITGIVDRNAKNRLAVRIHEHNRLFGHIFNWEGNWSGLYRDVELTATGSSWLETCAIYPRVDEEDVRVCARLGGDAHQDSTLRVSMHPIAFDAPSCTCESPVTDRTLEMTFAVPNPQLWSPESPALYRVDLEVQRGDEVLDAWSERVGFVKFSAEGRQLCINNQPYFWLGSGDHLASPETGSPDANREQWRRKLQVLREYGYLYVRCPSFVYTPEYFDAADEVGLVIQSEPGGIGPWGGHCAMHTYSWPKPTPDNYAIMKRQWNLSVLRDVNHPSANIYCMSNEFGEGTGYNFPRIAWELYHSTKAIKPTSLVIWTDGAWDDDMPGDFVNGEVYCDEGTAKPLIQHEFRWWSAFPDVRIKGKYRGAMRPFAIEMAEEAAGRWGLAHLLPEAAAVSQRLQYLEMKGKLEMLRRDHPRLAGISHFNAMDVGASSQGVVDQFYERKYADAALWRQTNNDTVILSGLNFDDRILPAGSTLQTALYISDYAHPPLHDPVLDWRLLVDGVEVDAGRIAFSHHPYATVQVGEVTARVPLSATPAAARLEAVLTAGDHRISNGWNLWVVPETTALPPGLVIYGRAQYSWLTEWAEIPVQPALPTQHVDHTRVVLTERLDAMLVAYMQAGGRVILVATEGIIRPHPPLFQVQPYYAGIRYFFTPPANYPPHEDGQNGTIIREHPMLGGYPHEGFADLQFFRLIDDAPPIDLAPLDLVRFEPIIRVIHRYPVFHPLAYLIEGRCGEGGLIISALDFRRHLPEARYLLGKVVEYAASPAFQPAGELSATTLDRLLEFTALP